MEGGSKQGETKDTGAESSAFVGCSGTEDCSGAVAGASAGVDWRTGAATASEADIMVDKGRELYETMKKIMKMKRKREKGTNV